jgi:pimeloyl-ACP methyl ester carboxylesterase
LRCPIAHCRDRIDPPLSGDLLVARNVISANISDLRGVCQLAVAAVIGTTRTVEEMHGTVVRALPFVGKPVAGAVLIIPGLVYRSIRGITRRVGGGLDTVFAQAESLISSPRVASSAERDAILAVINGVLGDSLVNIASPLAIPMRLRKNGQPLQLERKALASAFTPADRKLLVAIHGLCMTDTNRKGHDHTGSLARDLGYTPISLQYNSGRHVSTNGREFAGMMEQLVRAWPVPVDEVVIIGHSMGGLIARSACHYAKRERYRWLDKLRKLVFLGTPHHGAPLERAGNWLELLMSRVPHSAPLARLGGIRSAGIKDLRYGNLIDEDWQGLRGDARHDSRTPVPLPPGVQCFAVAASRRAKSAGHRMRPAGDGLVPVESALGQHEDPALDLSIPEHRRFTAQGLNHFELRTSPEVHEQLHLWLSGTHCRRGGGSVAS